MSLIYQWLWHLLPGNPMVVRIVESGSRRPRHLWVRMGYLGALITLVLIGLLSGGGMGGDVGLTELAKAGSQVFAIIAYGQVILVCLLAPLFMAAAIGQERAGETLSILLTTPLSNLQIVLGTLVGRLFFVLALLLSGLPLFAVLLIFGGVPVGSVFVAFAVAGLTALMVGSVAVALSVFRAGGRRAVFAFVISIAAYLVVAYVVDVGLIRGMAAASSGFSSGSGVGGGTTWLTPLHPLLVLESSIASANYRPPSPESLAHLPWPARLYLGQPFLAFTLLTLLISGALITVSALMLRRIGTGEGALGPWLRKKLRIGGGEGAERRRAPREVGHNPIAWREAKTRGKVASGIIARWGYATIMLSAAVALIIAYHAGALPKLRDPLTQAVQPGFQVFRTALVSLLLLEVAVVTLVAIYMSAGSVSREREDGTLDLVLTTPVTPQFYIWGKLQGLVRFLTLLIAVPVVTLALVSVYTLVGVALGWPQARATQTVFQGSAPATITYPLLLFEAPLLLAAMLVPFVALCVAAGMNWSLKAKGVLGAVVPTIAAIGVLTLILGLCGGNMSNSIPIVGPLVNAFSPATNLLMVIDPATYVEGFNEEPKFHRAWLFISALCAGGGYSLIVWYLIGTMVSGFDQTVRRLSGTA